MIGLGSSALKVFLAVEPCEMRKGFNGLAAEPAAGDAIESGGVNRKRGFEHRRR